MKSTTGTRPSRMSAALVSGALIVIGLWTGATAASATTTTVESVEFTNTSFRDQSVQTLDVTWRADESPAVNPVTVEFGLPEELKGQTNTFDIGNGTCEVTETRVSCVVDPDYVESNPLNIRGEFSIRVQVDLRNTETLPTATFDVGSVTTPPVEIASRYCTTNCEYGGTGPWKGGSYDNGTDNVTWTVGIPTVGEGVTSADDGRSLAAGQTVRVTDRFDQDNPFTLVGGPVVQRSSCLVTNEWNEQTLTGWTTLGAGEVTVTENGQVVEFTTAPGAGCADGQVALAGSVYRVQWTVHADDGGKGVVGPGQYRNEAAIAIGGVERETAGTATRFTNTGTAIGENFARFTLQKAFDLGDGVLAPGSITVDYEIDYPGDVPASTTGAITLNAGNDWSFASTDVFAGSVVTLSEADPWSSNVDAAATLSGPGVTENPDGSFTFTAGHADDPVALTLTNTATLQTQDLQARKALENPDGVTLPDDTAFELTATWPADDARFIAAGSASVDLPANGSAVTIGLPVGADVTFAETAPGAVPGATWEGSSVSPQTLTIGPGSEDVVVTATNVLSRNVGTFTIRKELTGDAAGLVADRTFSVAYSYPADPALGIEAGEGAVEVTAGGEPVEVTAPAGAVITLSEAPAEVEGGTWATPVFDPDSTFTVVQDQNVTVGLTNLITLDTGAFSIRKVVDGNAADQVDAGAEFVVGYAYPAGVGFPAGEGELVVKAGETVESPQLPYDAEVALTEVAPEDVGDATWAAPAFSQSSVRIGDGTTVEVTLTNTITDASLAATGGALPPWTATAATLLLLAGGALTATSVRRRINAAAARPDEQL